MKVSEFVDVLDVVAPTLAGSGLVNLMEDFWFSGGKVTTYNDRLAMEAPSPLDKDFTAPGRMRDVLKVSYQGGTLDFEFREREFDVFVGDNMVTFPTHNIRDTEDLFKMPKLKPNTPVFGEELGKALRSIDVCLLAVSNDAQYPERQGITIIPEDGKLSLYSFGNESLARCVLNGKGGANSRITVPTEFWTIFRNLTKGMDSKEAKAAVGMLLHADYALAQVGDVKLMGKTLPVPQATNLRKVFDDHYSDKEAKNLVPVTADLLESIARAVVLSQGDEDARTTLTVKNNELLIDTDARKGKQEDTLKFQHPNTKALKLKAALLHDGLGDFGPSEKVPSKVCITDRCVILKKAERVYMVSGQQN